MTAVIICCRTASGCRLQKAHRQFLSELFLLLSSFCHIFSPVTFRLFFCYPPSDRYLFLFCHVISYHFERFSIMTLYENNKFFLVFLSIISVFPLTASNTPPCEHAMGSPVGADIRSRLLYGFFHRESYGSGCPSFFLLQITAEIGKIRLS